MSHDRVLNFLVRESYVPFDLFERVKTMLNLAGGTLSVDDSVLDKPYSNPAVQELIGRHYSGKHHKTVQGICLVTLFYTDVSGGVFLSIIGFINREEIGQKTTYLVKCWQKYWTGV